MKKAEEKHKNKGGFEKHAYISYIKIAESNANFDYYKSRFDHYPEID